ncbi:MAG: DUF302 domain-containing protein [Pseudomonadota bacterium]
MRLRLIAIILFLPTMVYAAEEPVYDIAKTVVKMQIEEGVSIEEAISSMKLYANMLNMKLVAHQPLSEEYKALGLPNVNRTEIFQFCDSKIAKEMIEYDINYAAYMPCRITLVVDKQGTGWFVTMDLNIFIASAKLPERIHQLALSVRNRLMEIMKAGASGEL